MPSSFEDEVESYYKAKESYTELLHQCATAESTAESTDEASTNGHAAGEKSLWEEDPLSQKLSESMADAFAKIDLAAARIGLTAAMAKSKTTKDEPRKEQPKGKSKGKK